MASGVDLGDDGTDGRGKRYQQSKLANCVFTLALKVRFVLPFDSDFAPSLDPF